MEKVIGFFKRYRKIIISALVLVLFIVLLAAAIYFITLDDATYKEGDMSSTPYAASTYTKSVKFTDNGIIFLYKHKDETTGEEIEEEKTSSEMAQIIWDEMIKAGSTVGNYLSSVEELEKLMNAEIITQYPKLNKTVELNGMIEFKRHNTDGTTYMLEYVDASTFDNYIQNRDTNILKYYTLDDNGNVLIGIVDEATETLTSNDSEIILSDYTDMLSESNLNANGSYSRTEYSVYSKTINYKSVVSKYTMPFQYLWSFIVMGDDKGVGLDLADLVENSQIIISIYDNITTTVNTSTYTYNRGKKVNVSATATATINDKNHKKSDSWEPADEWEETDNYEVNHSTTYKNNTPIVDISKADVWIIDYSKEYTYQESNQTSQESNEKDLDDTDYVEDGENPKISYIGDGTDLQYYEHFDDKLEYLIDELEKDIANVVSASITYCKASYYKHNVNRHEKNISTVSAQKYVAGNVINNPKIEQKTDEEIKNGTGQDNFVTILCDESHQNAKRVIIDYSDWLFEMLEENPDTVNMVEMTKYLLNKVLGIDRFDTNFTFDEYENISFEDVTSFGSGGILGAFLASWENGAVWDYINGNGTYNSYIAKYITKDKKQYICYSDSSGGSDRNYGYGVCHTANGGSTYMHVSEYKENGINITSGNYDTVGVSKIDVSIVDAVKQSLLATMRTSIEKELAKNGINDLSENQLNALTAVKYQYGNIGNFAEMYKKYGDTDELKNNAKATGATNAYYFIEVKPGGDNAKQRAAANWKAFHEGVYVTQSGKTLDPDSYSSNGDFLNVAKTVWTTVCTSGKYTAYGGGGSIPVKGPKIDCSSFVSWCLYEYGYKEFAPYQKSAQIFYQTNWNSKYGWEEISVGSKQNPINQLQPGDIFVRYETNGTHHVTIVAEIKNGRLYSYDCGNTRASWNGTSGAPVDKTYFLTSSGPGKIIRVKPTK